jgi:hypothetical protein
MKKYYLHNGTEQDGPFDISELKSKGIKRDTEIWYEGISDWTEAQEIEELKVLFPKSTPPPIKPKSKKGKTKTEPKKNKLGRNLQILGGIILIGFLGFTVIPNIINNKDSGSYYEQKMTIEQTENSDPLRFLSVDGKYNESFWGTKFKLQAKITNRATIADYKDIVVKITYYSKTKSVIGNEDYTIYQIFKPNKITDFKLDVKNYKDVNSIGLELVSAIPN